MRNIILLIIFLFIQNILTAQLFVSIKDGMYGYEDKLGIEKIHYKYKVAGEFDWRGYAFVIKGNKQYLIDTLGTEYRLANNNIDSLFDETKALDLSSSQYQVIPSQVFDYQNIEIFFINDGNITTCCGPSYIEVLSPEIGMLINLKVLDLSRNMLKKIPNEIGKLKQLQYLDISSNEIDTLVSEIGNLINLKVLYLESVFKVKKVKINLHTLLIICILEQIICYEIIQRTQAPLQRTTLGINTRISTL